MNVNKNQCKECSCALTRKNIVKPNGNIHNRVMIVSDMPTSTENTTGEIFSSKYHEILKNKLKEHNIDIFEDVYCSLILRCSLQAKLTHQFRNNVTICSSRHYFLEYVRMKPRIILLIGSRTAETVLKSVSHMDMSKLTEGITTTLGEKIFIVPSLYEVDKTKYKKEIFNLALDNFCKEVNLLLNR